MTVINFDPIVYGVPKPTTPPPPVLWAPGQHTWTVGDKSWDLSGGLQGIRMQAGVRGLNTPEFLIYDDQSPAVSGSTYRGHIALPRDCTWPIWVFNNTSSEEWLKTDRAFWATMKPGITGTWTYVARDGVTRSLTCRFVSDNGKTHDDDPGLFGWQPYVISLRANDPFWHGPPIPGRFGGNEESATPFFGPTLTPGAPGMHIAGQYQMENARVSNPGDEPAWPRWTLYGPFTAAAVGIGGNSIEVPFTVADGAWVYIDTDPTIRTAMHGTGTPGPSTGTDRTSDLGLVNWGSIPPGSDIALAMEMTGTGWITIEIDPAYHRAY